MQTSFSFPLSLSLSLNHPSIPDTVVNSAKSGACAASSIDVTSDVVPCTRERIASISPLFPPVKTDTMDPTVSNRHIPKCVRFTQHIKPMLQPQIVVFQFQNYCTFQTLKKTLIMNPNISAAAVKQPLVYSDRMLLRPDRVIACVKDPRKVSFENTSSPHSSTG